MLRKQILLLGKQKMFLSGVKNIFASRTQILRPKHMFLSLATPGNITRNIVSATMFPSLARPLVCMPNDNVKFPNLRFKRQSEHTSVNLSFSIFTSTSPFAAYSVNKKGCEEEAIITK